MSGGEMKARHFLMGFALFFMFSAPVFAGENIGKVVGMVFDAQTKEVIEGAKIIVEDKGEFKEEKKSIVTTKNGDFLAQADLGASSSEFSMGALMMSSGISLLLNPGSVMKKTRSMDVDHINMKIEKDGYKTFWGSVPIFKVNAKQNQVILFPVFLAKNESPAASFVQTKFMEGKTLSVSVSPETVSLQDKKPKLHVTVQLPELPFPIMPPLKMQFDVSNDNQLAKFKDGTEDLWNILDKKITLKKNQKDVSYDFNLPQRYQTNEGAVIVRAMLIDEENTLVEGKTAVMVVRSQYVKESASLYGKAVLSFGDKEKVLTLLKEAVSAANVYFPAYKELAVYSTPQEAAIVLEPLLSQYPEDASLKILYARAQADLNNAQKAREILDATKNMKLSPGQKKSIAYLYGESFFLENNYDEALTYFKKADYADERKLQIAAQKNPEKEKSWLDLGNFYAKSAEFWEDRSAESYHDALKKAKEAYEKALVIKKDNAATLFSLGKIDFQRDDFPAAITMFEQAGEIKKSDKEIKEWLGLTAFRMGDEAKAKDALEAAKDKPKLFFTPYVLGLITYKNGDKEAAYKVWARALSLGREKVAGIKFKQVGAELGLGLYAKSAWHFFKGFAYDEAQNVVNVVESEAVLKNHPDNFLALYHLGDALVQMGLVDEGIASLNQCVVVNTEAQDCLLALGKAYAVKGDTAHAKDALNKLMAINSYHPEAPVLLASLYEKDKQFSEAKTVLENHLTYYAGDEDATLALGNVNAEIEQEKLKAAETVEPVAPKGEKKKPATMKKKESGKKKGTTKNKGKAKK